VYDVDIFDVPLCQLAKLAEECLVSKRGMPRGNWKKLLRHHRYLSLSEKVCAIRSSYSVYNILTYPFYLEFISVWLCCNVKGFMIHSNICNFNCSD